MLKALVPALLLVLLLLVYDIGERLQGAKRALSRPVVLPMSLRRWIRNTHLNASHTRNDSAHSVKVPGMTVASPHRQGQRVFVLTFSDKKDTPYLHALAACVLHFNDAPLYVLGLSGRRSPELSKASHWSIQRKAISGTDPGKLKKLWFLGALFEQSAPLGMHDRDLVLFLDAFDTLVQRRLVDDLPKAFSTFIRSTNPSLKQGQQANDLEAVVVMGEHNCWPWPRPDLEMGPGKRPRGLSMNYMPNGTFKVVADPQLKQVVQIPSQLICAALSSRTKPGRWLYPNSGAILSTLQGMRALLERLRQLVSEGHFEDQAMVGLALLQHPRGAIHVDSNASIFSSQYGYQADWWARPACFSDYFGQDDQPPVQKATGVAPFAMHFNGPAGRYRLGWCVSAFLRKFSWPHQYYIDVDGGNTRVELPRYCDPSLSSETAHLRGELSSNVNVSVGVSPSVDETMRKNVPLWASARGAIAPNGHTPVKPSVEPCTSHTQQRVRCINDRCFTFRGT